jgi:hypothetical protein
MNERIKLLAEQAGLKHHNWITNKSNVKDGNFKYPRLEDYEKFAELIVWDCIDIIAPYTVRMSRPGEEYLHPIQEIRKHFGVES